jgi:hypothetical protein
MKDIQGKAINDFGTAVSDYVTRVLRPIRNRD